MVWAYLLGLGAARMFEHGRRRCEAGRTSPPLALRAMCNVLGVGRACYIPASFGIVDEDTDACMEYAQRCSASQVATTACRKLSD